MKICFDAKFDIAKFDQSYFDMECQNISGTEQFWELFTRRFEPPIRTGWTRGKEGSLLIER